MLDLNIKRIVFSSKNNNFISATPNEIKINHISAGNKFIKNKVNMKDNEEKENIDKLKNSNSKKYKKISRQ